MAVVRLLQRESATMKQDRSTPIKETAEQPKEHSALHSVAAVMNPIPKPHARRCISPNS